MDWLPWVLCVLSLVLLAFDVLGGGAYPIFGFLPTLRVGWGLFHGREAPPRDAISQDLRALRSRRPRAQAPPPSPGVWATGLPLGVFFGL